jgi:hypothetical protein
VTLRILIFDPASDPWLGSLEHFPNVFHARASCLHEINEESLQKILVSTLEILQEDQKSLDITMADRSGYVPSQLRIRVGIGNREAFDVLDVNEKTRLLTRIEHMGPFKSLDLLVTLHYIVEDGKLHKPHQDRYIIRFVFRPGLFEILLHHQKGIRRIDSDEIIRLLIDEINQELVRNKYSKLELETLVTS